MVAVCKGVRPSSGPQRAKLWPATMNPLLIYGTGWLSAGLIAAAIPGPLINHLLTRFGLQPVGWLFRWHYWFGGSAAVVATIHALISITRAELALAAEIGLWVASAAGALVVIESVLGAAMRGMREPARGRSRQRHLGLMAALVIAVGLHEVLNGPIPH